MNGPTFAFVHDSSVDLCTDKGQFGEAKINSISKVIISGTMGRLTVKALTFELHHSKFSSSPLKNSSDSLQSRFNTRPSLITPTMTTRETEMTKKFIVESSFNITAFVPVEKRTNTNNADMVLGEVSARISVDD